jgi:hypothetical protein
MSFQCPEGLRCLCAEKAARHGAAAAFSGDYKHLAMCVAYVGVCASSAVLTCVDSSGAMSGPSAAACAAVVKGLVAYEKSQMNA